MYLFLFLLVLVLNAALVPAVVLLQGIDNTSIVISPVTIQVVLSNYEELYDRVVVVAKLKNAVTTSSSPYDFKLLQVNVPFTITDVGFYHLDILNSNSNSSSTNDIIHYMFTVTDTKTLLSAWPPPPSSSYLTPPVRYSNGDYNIDSVMYPRHVVDVSIIPITIKLNTNDHHHRLLLSIRIVKHAQARIKVRHNTLDTPLLNQVEFVHGHAAITLDLVDTPLQEFQLELCDISFCTVITEQPIKRTTDNENVLVVESDLIIPKGQTVVISAGTIVQVSPNVGISVYGTLVIAGDRNNPVSFVSKCLSSYWKSINLETPTSNVTATYTFFVNGGYTTDEILNSFTEHRYDTPVFNLRSTAYLNLDHSAVIQSQGQGILSTIATSSSASIITLESVMFQGLSCAIHTNATTLFVLNSYFSDFPSRKNTWNSNDNDIMYIIDGSARIVSSVLSNAADDGIDSGTGLLAGSLEITNCTISSCAHEGIALSNQRDLKDVRVTNTTVSYCHQGIEVGFSNHRMIVSLHSVVLRHNVIGLRYGDNYTYKLRGFVKVSPDCIIRDNIQTNVLNLYLLTLSPVPNRIIFRDDSWNKIVQCAKKSVVECNDMNNLLNESSSFNNDSPALQQYVENHTVFFDPLTPASVIEFILPTSIRTAVLDNYIVATIPVTIVASEKQRGGIKFANPTMKAMLDANKGLILLGGSVY